MVYLAPIPRLTTARDPLDPPTFLSSRGRPVLPQIVHTYGEPFSHFAGLLPVLDLHFLTFQTLSASSALSASYLQPRCRVF